MSFRLYSALLAYMLTCFAFSSLAQTVKPVIKWKFETNDQIWGSSASKDGVVYFGSLDKSAYALDTDTGEKIWSFETGGSIYSGVHISDSFLYVSSDDGFLYKLNLSDGSEVWKCNINENAPAERAEPADTPPGNQRWDYRGSAPVEADSLVYVGSADFSIYAVNKITGVKEWSYRTNDIVRSDPAVSGNYVVIGSFDGNVYAFDKDSGNVIWSFNTGGPVNCSPLIYNNVVYIGSRSTRLYALNLETGTVKWVKQYGQGSWVDATAVLYDSTIYIGSSFWSTNLAIDPETGTSYWEAAVGGPAYATPVLTEDAFYSGTTGLENNLSGNFRGSLGRLNRHTGKAEWRYYFPVIAGYYDHGVGCRPEYVDSTILFGALDGFFYAFTERAGNVSSFNSNKTTISAGESFILSWETLPGAVVTLNGQPVGNTGSLEFTLEEDSSFILTASKDGYIDSSLVLIRVLPASQINRALNKSGFGSSVFPGADNAFASLAFDGNNITGWRSAASDSQWIYVDLEEVYKIKRVRLTWHPTHKSKAYFIDVSPDNLNWTEIYRTDSAEGRTNDLKGVDGEGRYVRLYCLTRNTVEENRLYEFEVYEDFTGQPNVTDVPEGKLHPLDFVLEQNYPNPFNPESRIQYTIGSPPAGRAGKQFVTLKIFDVLGKEVAALINEEKSPGTYSVKFDASDLTSGVYFYKLTAGNFSKTKKMILLR